MGNIRHGRKNRNWWIDLGLIDLYIVSTISILLLLVKVGNDPVYEQVHWEFVKSEDKDYNKHILTDKELAELYTCKTDGRITNTNIIELTYEEAQLLMKVARKEGGATLDGQLWVMRTIINRVQSEYFPDNVYDVVNEHKGDNWQFEVVKTGVYEKAELNSESHIALSMIESGWNQTDGSLWFEAATNTSNSWHAQNRELIKEVEGQRYYK